MTAAFRRMRALLLGSRVPNRMEQMLAADAMGQRWDRLTDADRAEEIRAAERRDRAN